MINLDSDAEISKRAVTEYNISINMPLDILRSIYSLLFYSFHIPPFLLKYFVK